MSLTYNFLQEKQIASKDGIKIGKEFTCELKNVKEWEESQKPNKQKRKVSLCTQKELREHEEGLCRHTEREAQEEMSFLVKEEAY